MKCRSIRVSSKNGGKVSGGIEQRGDARGHSRYASKQSAPHGQLQAISRVSC